MPSLQRYKTHGRFYYRIVESFRKDGKPRIRVLAHLGKVEDILALAQGRSTQVRLRTFMAGAVCALYQLSEELELAQIIDQALQEYGRSQIRDQLSVGQSLVAATIARACAPSSKRAFAEWAEQTYLPDLMDFEAGRLTSQHFWDQMNRVPIEALGKIEERVLTRLVKLESLAIDACVYDTTNFYTYIATENARSELAQRGQNKQKRHDLRQFGLALVVDRLSQLPLFHHLYSGQRNDARTLGDLIAPIRKRLKKLRTQPEQLTFIFDAGANSTKNLQELKAHYVVVLRSFDHRKWLSEVASQLETITLLNGEEVQAYRQSKVVLGQEREVVVFVSSTLQEGQRRGLLQHLQKITPELEKIGLHSRYRIPTVEQRLQKLLDRQYIRHLIHYELTESPDGGTDLRFWSDLEEYRRLENRYFGFRILATDRSDWTTEEIIEAHRSQPRSESCFKDLKNPTMIATRPQFHWTDQKLRVHTFTCVLAYLLTRLLWWRYQRHDNRFRSPRSLLAELKKIRVARIADATGRPGRPRVYYQLEELDSELEELAQRTGAIPQL